MAKSTSIYSNSFQTLWHILVHFIVNKSISCMSKPNLPLPIYDLANSDELNHSVAINACYHAVDKIFQQWLCVEQSCELFTNIRGRGGARNVSFYS